MRPASASNPATRSSCAAGPTVLPARRPSMRRSPKVWQQAGFARPGCVQMAPGTDRGFVAEMLAAAGLIDLLIPRGGKSLRARACRQDARMPVLAHADGPLPQLRARGRRPRHGARVFVVNAKMRRTGICGATETLLIDAACCAHPAAADRGRPVSTRLPAAAPSSRAHADPARGGSGRSRGFQYGVAGQRAFGSPWWTISMRRWPISRATAAPIPTRSSAGRSGGIRIPGRGG